MKQIIAGKCADFPFRHFFTEKCIVLTGRNPTLYSAVMLVEAFEWGTQVYYSWPQTGTEMRVQFNDTYLVSFWMVRDLQRAGTVSTVMSSWSMHVVPRFKFELTLDNSELSDPDRPRVKTQNHGCQRCALAVRVPTVMLAGAGETQLGACSHGTSDVSQTKHFAFTDQNDCSGRIGHPSLKKY